MCMLCGDVSQIPNEIKTGSILLRALVTLPFVGLITLQQVRSIKELISRTKNTNEIKDIKKSS